MNVMSSVTSDKRAAGRRVVVSNAGMHPELAWLAAELARRGELDSYHTSLSWARDERVGKLIRRSIASGGIGRYLERRLLPPGLPKRVVHRRARIVELAARLMRPLSERASHRLIVSRNRCFDLSLSRYMKRASVQTVVLQGGGVAVRTLGVCRARNIRTILNCPLPHHDWMLQYFAEERRRNPQWAPTLQHADISYTERRRFEKEISLSDFLLTASTFAARTYSEMGTRSSQLLTVSLGVEQHPAIRERSPSKLMGLSVLYVGQITQRKGVSYLLDAFLAADIPGSRLTLAGQAVGHVERLIPRRDDVRLTGPVSRAKLSELLEHSDVLVLPSLADGFGLVILEAMAAGVPVIASTHTAGADVVEDGVSGYLIEPRDSRAIVQRLELLARDPILRQQLSAGAAKVARSRSWGRYASDLADLVQEQLDPGREVPVRHPVSGCQCETMAVRRAHMENMVDDEA